MQLLLLEKGKVLPTRLHHVVLEKPGGLMCWGTSAQEKLLGPNLGLLF